MCQLSSVQEAANFKCLSGPVADLSGQREHGAMMVTLKACIYRFCESAVHL